MASMVGVTEVDVDMEAGILRGADGWVMARRGRLVVVEEVRWQSHSRDCLWGKR